MSLMASGVCESSRTVHLNFTDLTPRQNEKRKFTIQQSSAPEMSRMLKYFFQKSEEGEGVCGVCEGVCGGQLIVFEIRHTSTIRNKPHSSLES